MAVPIDALRCRAIFSFTRCTGYENHQGDHSFRSDEGVIYIRPGESVVGFTEDPNNPKCEHGWFEGRYIKWCNRPASHTGDHYFQKPDSDDPADRDWIEMEIGETDPPARPIQWPLAFTMSVFFLSVAFTICFTVWTVNR